MYPFFAWEKLMDRQPGSLNRLETGDDLVNNIEEVVQTTYRIFVGGQ